MIFKILLDSELYFPLLNLVSPFSNLCHFNYCTEFKNLYKNQRYIVMFKMYWNRLKFWFNDHLNLEFKSLSYGLFQFFFFTQSPISVKKIIIIKKIINIVILKKKCCEIQKICITMWYYTTERKKKKNQMLANTWFCLCAETVTWELTKISPKNMPHPLSLWRLLWVSKLNDSKCQDSEETG